MLTANARPASWSSFLLTVVLAAGACGDDSTSGAGGSGGIAWTGGNGGAGASGGTTSGVGGSGGISPDGGGGEGAGGNSGGGGSTSGGGGVGGDGAGGVGGTGGDGGGNGCQTPDDCDDLVGCTDDVCTVGVGCSNAANSTNCLPTETCNAVEDCQANATITSVSPNDGLATATTAVRIIGTGFTANAAVTFNGITASCTFAGVPTTILCDVPPGAVGLGTVGYTPATGPMATLVNGWTFTGVLNESNLANEADFCNLQFPLTTTATAGQASSLIFGQIYEATKTDATVGGAAPGILAELGFGPGASNPTVSGAWRFGAATFNVEVGNNDEYQGTLLIPAAGTYSYTYRFSLDAGLNFTYCDTDGSGSNGGLDFASTALGTITVN